ncbi:hypothetical protein [Jeotgalibacillus soli]|uniref:Uncharacterized protein n=1 Tax=Jeotgalibacillus soli TaxID=889306 RepID=A0A0C2RU33_9BACL|nr:hypothetical protein [Jeotgalibacillus soli]KIL45264.1 hypothetical protein KP78_28080 [Jeotgalibacillus soli]
MEKDHQIKMYKESDDHSQELLKKIESSSSYGESKQLDNWFFGNRIKESNDRKQNEQSKNEHDRFTEFLFGQVKVIETSNEKEGSHTSRSNRMNDWFFGNRGKEDVSSPNVKDPASDQISDNTPIPLINKATPFLNKALKRFHSKKEKD